MSGAHHWWISVLALTLAAFGGASAEAAPGDIHRVVNADRVNLRAGPSDESSVRGTIERGDEVIELTHATTGSACACCAPARKAGSSDSSWSRWR